MVGFILMIDDFTPENGATCFAPGSQGREALPASFGLLEACGASGSVIVFNGSVWHGYGPNLSDTLRRSIQGAYIRRTEVSAAESDIAESDLEDTGHTGRLRLRIQLFVDEHHLPQARKPCG